MKPEQKASLIIVIGIFLTLTTSIYMAYNGIILNLPNLSCPVAIVWHMGWLTMAFGLGAWSMWSRLTHDAQKPTERKTP